jgi:hypothetical protein
MQFESPIQLVHDWKHIHVFVEKERERRESESVKERTMEADRIHHLPVASLQTINTALLIHTFRIISRLGLG